jgi:hypothetical protein
LLLALVTSNPGSAQWLFAIAALAAILGALVAPWVKEKPYFPAFAFFAACVVLAFISIGLLVAF